MRLRRLAAAAFLFGGLIPVGGVAPAACAAEGPHAVLVVDTEAPGGQFRYCVALPDGSVTGIELIRLASEQHGLQYRLGYGGNAVCQLAGVGYDSDECLKDGPEFWGYWRGDGSGGWGWSSSGAQATVIRDGDVDGWSWGTGNDGTTHPAPPATTFASVCGERTSGGDVGRGDDGTEGDGRKDRVDRKARPDKKPRAVAAGSPDAGETATQRQGKRKPARRTDKDRPGRKRGRATARAARAATVSSSPTPSASPAGRGIPLEPVSTGGGPPVGGVVAGLATLGFVATGIVLQRRRTRPR